MEITEKTIDRFISNIEEPRLTDIKKLIEIGKKLTHKEPMMWGTIIGFGNLHYKYKTGHQGDMPLFAFANRKQALTLYLSYDIAKYELLNELGKHKIGKGCLYIKKLSDINLDVLESLINIAIQDILNTSFITDNEA